VVDAEVVVLASRGVLSFAAVGVVEAWLSFAAWMMMVLCWWGCRLAALAAEPEAPPAAPRERSAGRKQADFPQEAVAS
jgi:hypothetical protein